MKIKKYFYVLSPLLACGWIERYDAMPPMAFEELVQELVPATTPLYMEIHELLRRKRRARNWIWSRNCPQYRLFWRRRLSILNNWPARWRMSGLFNLKNWTGFSVWHCKKYGGTIRTFLLTQASDSMMNVRVRMFYSPGRLADCDELQLLGRVCSKEHRTSYMASRVPF